ncbi:hypothetical protein T484DRAFT_1762840 [Baffinella frigidus]|nr:hypothetical protein T484DRAFT_1762840 [Cryptophyta sp. CCMP2293]
MHEDPDMNLGRQVEMIFDDGEWYAGVLTRYHPRSGKYRVLFEDGDEQDTDLPHPEVRFRALDAPKSKKRRKS